MPCAWANYVVSAAQKLLNVWHTDSSSTDMFLPAAHSFVFLYGNSRAATKQASCL